MIELDKLRTFRQCCSSNKASAIRESAKCSFWVAQYQDLHLKLLLVHQLGTNTLVIIYVHYCKEPMERITVA